MRTKALVRAALIMGSMALGVFVSAHNDISEYDDYTYTNEETGTMVRIYVDGETRYFESNALPDHETGEFPNSGNPNSISAQNLALTTPANPELADEITEVGLGKFGLALNGIPFEREAAEWYNRDRASGWQYDAFGGGIELGLDFNSAHVQPTGLYHYHGVPEVLVENEAPEEHPHLVGFAADGFPIYLLFAYADATDPTSAIIAMTPSYRVKSGERPTVPFGAYDGTFNEDWEFVEALGDLDVCNGRFGITPEFPEGTYYYVLTEAFPRVPTCWRGTPGEGWAVGGGAGQMGQAGQQPPSQSGQGPAGQQPPPPPDGPGGQPPAAPQGSGG